jgi:hypothetical protein
MLNYATVLSRKFMKKHRNCKSVKPSLWRGGKEELYSTWHKIEDRLYVTSDGLVFRLKIAGGGEKLIWPHCL